MVFEKKYSDAVRKESVDRVLERRRLEPGNRSIIREVADEFDVGEQSLRQWLVRVDDGSYGPRRGATGQDGRDADVLRARVEELEQVNTVLKSEIDALKRTVAIFAAESMKRSP